MGDRGERLLGVVVFLAFLSSIIAMIVQSARRRRTLKAVATRLQGAFVWSFPYGYRVEFKVNGVPAQLTRSAASTKSSPVTRLQIAGTFGGQLRIFPNDRFFSSLRKVFGAQDIAIGDPSFDGEFVVQGSPETWVRNLLDPAIRERIGSFLGGSAFTVDIGPTGIAFSCRRDLADDPVRLQAFIDDALGLFSGIVERCS